jgi:heptosyltransferase-1
VRVLIIKTSALGDVVQALPVLAYLHEVSPGVVIDWVVEEAFLPVVQHNPMISSIHTVRTKAWRKQPFGRETRSQINELRRALHERHYDLAFDLQGNLKSGLIAMFCGAPVKVGFTRAALQEKLNLLFTTRQVPFSVDDKHAADRYLRLVSAPFGGDFNEVQISTDIVSAPEDEAAAKQYLSGFSGGRLLLFQVGTTWSTKMWYLKGWIELASRVLERYPDARILINWGSDDEKALAEIIRRAVGGRVALLPWLKIKELIPVIRHVDLVIGGDTGPIYLAAAVGTPTVSYYRATSAQLYAPRGECHVALQSGMECAGCQRTTCERDAECRESVTVGDLLSATIQLLENSNCERVPRLC